MSQVGVVLASSKFGDNVEGKEVLPNDWGTQPGKDKLAGKAEEDFFSQLDWVVVLPDARAKPVGSWRSHFICHEDRLLRVKPGVIAPPLLAMHRKFCTAFRLLEDYGNLRSRDVVIINAPHEPTGESSCPVLLLCNWLLFSSISNLVSNFHGLFCANEMSQA
eukprot:COSAG05_NODE_12_length_37297_cov_117.537072_4_plen_162_part_00